MLANLSISQMGFGGACWYACLPGMRIPCGTNAAAVSLTNAAAVPSYRGPFRRRGGLGSLCRRGDRSRHKAGLLRVLVLEARGEGGALVIVTMHAILL